MFEFLEELLFSLDFDKCCLLLKKNNEKNIFLNIIDKNTLCKLHDVSTLHSPIQLSHTSTYLITCLSRIVI